MPDLRSSVAKPSKTSASDVLAAIRAASLDELVADVRRPSSPSRSNGVTPKRTFPRTKPSGHLARRAPEQVARTLAEVHALLNARRPMRAEQIREVLQYDKRDLPRVLHLGLRHKTLRSKGLKRSSTYSAA